MVQRVLKERVLKGHLLGQAGVGSGEGQGGAVTVIQRFGSAANLNIHLHCPVLDGVYRCGSEGVPVFIEADGDSEEARSLRPLQAAFRPGRIGWTGLLKRVFGIDVRRCLNCGSGELKIIAAIVDQAVIERILSPWGWTRAHRRRSSV